jgi:hypothetical protein
MTAVTIVGMFAAGYRRTPHVSSLFCRHNRFTADCPICSKGSVLSDEPRQKPERPRAAAKPRGRGSKKAAAPAVSRGPYASAGPFDHDGRLYEVRLEKVLGALRLGEWRDGLLEKRAPVLPGAELRRLLEGAAEQNVIGFGDWDAFSAALGDASAEASPVAEPGAVAASPGQAGDLREEFRIEAVGDGLVRMARWLFWPGGGAGWELQDAPVMYPEKRYVEVIRRAVEQGIV